MKRRNYRLFFALMTIFLLCLSACTGKKDEEESKGFDIAGKTYYNTVDEYGNDDHSKVWFGKDGSFVINDNYYDGSYEINGSWSLNENVVTLNVSQSGVGEFSKIIFEVEDEETLKLKTMLAGSKSDQVFSINEVKGSSASSSTSNFKYGYYYNTSQGGNNPSELELRADGSFTLLDKNDFGISEYNGTYSQDDEYLYLKCVGVYDGVTYIFKVEDPKNLVLQVDVGVSATGDKFSMDYVTPAVKDVPCTGLTSLYKNYWAYEGVGNYDLEAKAEPSNTTDKITYYSEDEKIVTVNESGICKAVNPGTTKIHIKCGDIERIVSFETRSKAVGVSDIILDAKSYTVYMNNTEKITAKVEPDTATDKKLTYKSSDNSIVQVDDFGTLLGKMPGNAKVTVTAASGVSVTADVCVEGTTVIYEMENNVSVKAGSGAKIPYKATLIACYDGVETKQDVTTEVDFHTAYTSALDIDGSGNVYAKGAVYETTDIPVHFSFSDGSSLYVESKEYIVHVEK
ncbi:MAG: Ig-like domain-containing protein [Erysipelotrichaceae bacterium]|nr:Ig-like domain-containing protein [Erysipelotrichaceae bacterium]